MTVVDATRTYSHPSDRVPMSRLGHSQMCLYFYVYIATRRDYSVHLCIACKSLVRFTYTHFRATIAYLSIVFKSKNIERDRQTDRQTGRQAGRQADRQAETDRQPDRQPARQRHRETQRE